jgi:hypothetical protein
MKPIRVLVVCCALGVLAADAAPARAAWDSVFQVCWFHHREPVTASYYAAPVVANSSPCCAPCPQTTCTTNYVQRCYYQPVTTYQTRTYYEPVTTYRTSYYYEPVTSYRYSCYVDPCTGCPQQVATPCTSYQLRSQCCPVQSWVQRCCSVPVTSYQRCSYWEPQTTCCTAPAPTPCCQAVPAVPAVPAAPPAAVGPPGVTEQRSLPPAPPPRIQENRSGGTQFDQYYGPTAAPNPPSSLRQPPLSLPAPVDPSRQAAPPPTVKLERIVFGNDTPVDGRVVRFDNAPRAGARLLFVRADGKGGRQVVTANGTGRFQVTLASGAWHVYLSRPDGSQDFHSRIDIGDRQPPFLTLVSR